MNCLFILDEIFLFFSNLPKKEWNNFLLTNDYLKDQKVTNENEDFFEFFFGAQKSYSVACKNYFLNDFEFENLLMNINDKSSLSENRIDFENIRKLFFIFLILFLVFFGIIYLIKKRKIKTKLGNEFNEMRIPKYSVIYI